MRISDEYVFEGTYNDLLLKAATKGTLEMADVISLLRELQANKTDCHLAIGGQNGVGKSIVLLMMQKAYQGKISFDNLFLADKTTNDIIRFLLTNRNTLLCIDELNISFGYKQHATTEQNHLISMVELARSKMIPIVGCIRDPRKLTLNYRQGKLSICIWVLDRLKKDKGAYAAVFVANNMVEGEDRFGWQYLTIDSFDYDQMRSQIEKVPSFVCYMWIPPALKILTKDEIAAYDEKKDVAQAYAHLNHVIKQVKKGKMLPEDAELEISVLEKIIPDARSRLPVKKDSKQGRLFEDED
jgi:hypothetical protein